MVVWSSPPWRPRYRFRVHQWTDQRTATGPPGPREQVLRSRGGPGGPRGLRIRVGHGPQIRATSPDSSSDGLGQLRPESCDSHAADVFAEGYHLKGSTRSTVTTMLYGAVSSDDSPPTLALSLALSLSLALFLSQRRPPSHPHTPHPSAPAAPLAGEPRGHERSSGNTPYSA